MLGVPFGPFPDKNRRCIHANGSGDTAMRVDGPHMMTASVSPHAMETVLSAGKLNRMHGAYGTTLRTTASPSDEMADGRKKRWLRAARFAGIADPGPDRVSAKSTESRDWSLHSVVRASLRPRKHRGARVVMMLGHVLAPPSITRA